VKTLIGKGENIVRTRRVSFEVMQNAGKEIMMGGARVAEVPSLKKVWKTRKRPEKGTGLGEWPGVLGGPRRAKGHSSWTGRKEKPGGGEHPVKKTPLEEEVLLSWKMFARYTAGRKRGFGTEQTEREARRKTICGS